MLCGARPLCPAVAILGKSFCARRRLSSSVIAITIQIDKLARALIAGIGRPYVAWVCSSPREEFAHWTTIGTFPVVTA